MDRTSIVATLLVSACLMFRMEFAMASRISNSYHVELEKPTRGSKSQSRGAAQSVRFLPNDPCKPVHLAAEADSLMAFINTLQGGRVYFDNTIACVKSRQAKMHAEYMKDNKGFEMDPALIDYDSHVIKQLQEKWHTAFNNVFEQLTPYLKDATAAGSVMKPKRRDLRNAVLGHVSRMSVTVNREYKEFFLKRPAYYQGRWMQEINLNTGRLTAAARALAADSAPKSYGRRATLKVSKLWSK